MADLVRKGRSMLPGGFAVPETEMSATASNFTKYAGRQLRKAAVNGVVDKMVWSKAQEAMEFYLYTHFEPDFDHTPSKQLTERTAHVGLVGQGARRIPRRMLNIDTGNLDEWPSGQYCILSHSWKGNEITFPMLQRVQAGSRKREAYDEYLQDADPTEEATMVAKFQARKYAHLKPEMSDVELLRVQCEKELAQQTSRIQRLIDLDGSPAKRSVRGLLETLASYKIAAQDKTEAESAYNELVARLIDEASGRSMASPTATVLRKSVPDSEKAKAEEERDRKRARFDATEAEWLAVANPKLRTQLQAMLPVLEQMKSLVKIECSLRETRRQLDSGLFGPQRGARYLWNDTICINKQDANELNDALSMMGEWYANAELCLVHIDSPAMNWIEVFEPTAGALTLPNFRSFGELTAATPKWATRGWTLQELVLPKVCAFANCDWQHLARPAEALGPYYYLVGFLEIHVPDQSFRQSHESTMDRLESNETLRVLMAEADISYTEFGVPTERQDFVEMARRLISILDFLGVNFERNMTEDTAAWLIQEEIDRASRVVKVHMIEDGASRRPGQLQRLFTGLGFNLTTNTVSLFIKLVLNTLVNISVPIIHADKHQMFWFTNVPSQECCRGFKRPQNTAEKILQLAAYRECTVATDRVYSLMGVLGVHFNVFHAEGLSKALSRLLDEVVITSNDVSVFNWSGQDLGSSQRGRSMFPRALEAYDPLRDQEAKSVLRRTKLAQAKQFKNRRYMLHQTSNRLSKLLRGFVDLAKGPHRNQLPIKALQNLLAIVRETSLDHLQHQLDTLQKLSAYFHTVDKTAEFATVVEDVMEHAIPQLDTPDAIESPLATPLVDEQAPSDEQDAKAPGRRSFGIRPSTLTSLRSARMSSRLSSFTRHKEDKTAADSSITNGKVSSTPSGSKLSLERTESSLTAGALDTVHDWLVQASSISTDTMSAGVKRTLDKYGDRSNLDANEEYAAKYEESMIKQAENPQSADDAISPNPIIVNTSGIEGVFDIQRIVMTMNDPIALRDKVRRIAHPSQKVSGVCTISTATVSVELEFQCTAKELGNQLDVCDAVDHTIFHIDDKQRIRNGKKARKAEDISQEEKTRREEQAKEERQTAETTRMLAFVEETNLSMITGEWVLAKFSGAPAANWFLCLLELGSTHTLYGRRIPTNAIDFTLSAPDDRLVKPWEDYMEAKKQELCRLWSVQLHGQQRSAYFSKAGGKLESLSDRLRRASSRDSTLTSETPPDVESMDGEAEKDDSDSDDATTLIGSLLERGTTYTSSVGKSIGTFGEGIGKLHTAFGERLDAALSDNVLRKTPQRLRAAIVNLNQNADLVPTGFISGVQVHMF